jgi:hypothetical protein
MRLFLAFLISFPALACSCGEYSTCDLLQLPVLFIGQVVEGGVSSIRIDPWYNNVQHARFKVIENFRGLPPGTQTVDVQVGGRAGMCSPDLFFPGHTYLVAPSKRNGVLSDSVCSPSRDVQGAADDVRMVRDYFAGKMQLNVHGRVAVAKAASLVDFELELGEANSLGGVTITATRGNRDYSTVTAPDGRNFLKLPGQGQYQLRANLTPYSAEPMSIAVANACAVQNLALHVDNTISGRVFDAAGKAVKNARVGLIDVDQLASTRSRHVWFRDAYTEQPDVTFLFKNVPPGKYLLMFNPDGPRPNGIEAGLRDESTFYPIASDRLDAKVVEIKSGGVHLTGMSLAMGRAVPFRSVTVRVRFSDGAPMDTAQIRCVGKPLRAGGLPWIFEKYVIHGENGTLQFSAPANRNLELEVTDAYERDLKARYTSSHDAGKAPIIQEFVVSP